MEIVGRELPLVHFNKRALASALAVVMVVAIGLEFGISRAAGARGWTLRPELPLRGPMAATGGFGREASGGGAGLASSAVEGDMPLEAFLDLLQSHAPEPVAKKVLQALSQEPSIAKAFEEFREANGQDATAGRFVEHMMRVPEFRQLAARFFQGDAGFRAAYQQLARNPAFEGVLRAALASSRAQAAGAAAGSRSFRSLARGSWSVAAAGAAGARGSGASPGAVGAGGVGPRAVTASTLPGSGAAAAKGGGGADHSSGDYRVDGAVTPLASIPGAGNEVAINPEDPSVFTLLPRWVRDKLDAICTKKGICTDFAKQCWIAGVYDECVAACNKTSKCRGSLPGSPPFRATEVVEDGEGKQHAVVDPEYVQGESGQTGATGLATGTPPAPELIEVPQDQPSSTWEMLLTLGGGAGAVGLALLLANPGGLALVSVAALGMGIGAALGKFLDTSGLGNVLGKAVVSALSDFGRGVANVVTGAIGAVGDFFGGLF